DAIADHAVEFIREESAAAAPFFLYLAFTAPHFPLQAPLEAIERCRGRFRSGWDSLRAARFARQKALGILGPDAVLSPRHPKVASWDRVADPDLEDLRMAIYAAQIERLDAGVGRVLNEIRRQGREQDTLFIVLSDNGAEGGADLARFREDRFNRAPF